MWIDVLVVPDRPNGPVMIERQDGSLAERIDFSGAAHLRATDTEIATFAEDHWALRIDGGRLNSSEASEAVS